MFTTMTSLLNRLIQTVVTFTESGEKKGVSKFAVCPLALTLGWSDQVSWGIAKTIAVNQTRKQRKRGVASAASTNFPSNTCGTPHAETT